MQDAASTCTTLTMHKRTKLMLLLHKLDCAAAVTAFAAAALTRRWRPAALPAVAAAAALACGVLPLQRACSRFCALLQIQLQLPCLLLQLPLACVVWTCGRLGALQEQPCKINVVGGASGAEVHSRRQPHACAIQRDDLATCPGGCSSGWDTSNAFGGWAARLAIMHVHSITFAGIVGMVMQVAVQS